MSPHKFRWILFFYASLFTVLACGQLSIEVLTPTPQGRTNEQVAVGVATSTLTLEGNQNEQTPTPTFVETPKVVAFPTSEWSQYWVEVQDPYHDVRFAMPCFWQAQFPLEEPGGKGAFAYPIKNYSEEYVFNFPRSYIPPEAGAIKIDMNFMSASIMRNLPPDSNQFDFVNALYSGDSEARLVSTQEVEINGQPALYVTTESDFGAGNFYLFTVTDDLFLAFGAASELMTNPDVQGILNSISLSADVHVQFPDHKPASPPTGLAAPCIPGYEQEVVPTVNIPKGNTPCGLSSFVELESLVEAIQGKLKERNFGSLHYDHFINDPFLVGYWGSEYVVRTPMETATQLANTFLPFTDTELTFTTDRAQFPPLAGTPPEYMFGPNVNIAQVVYSEGWGEDGRGAALLYFAQDQCAGFYWYGLVYSREHFDKEGYEIGEEVSHAFIPSEE